MPGAGDGPGQAGWFHDIKSLAKVAHYNRGSSTVDVEETMALQPSRQNWISPEEYLAGELISDMKHEYIDGEVYAMTGTSINHGRIISVMMRLLGNHLANTPCDVFAADIKVKAQNNFFYPDLIVDCQKLNGEVYVTEAPLIIVEVLSKSTRKLDQTLKRLAYQSLSSLQEYVLIEQDFVDIEICRRNNHWQSEHFYLGDQVYFSAIDLSLPVEQIYARVDNEDMHAFTLVQSQQNPSL
jgi:Uma2 family endonuclease